MNSILTTAIPDKSVVKMLTKIISKVDLRREEMSFLLKEIMVGQLSNCQAGAILTALRMKGESVEELTGAVEVMRELVKPVFVEDNNIIDLCGTGGDGVNTFNISTSAMFIASAAGAKVAKHGGRAVSSATGSADLLEGLGVKISLPPEKVLQTLDQVGLGFMFAPNHHPAMKVVAPIRRELGVRTIFNVLGPLTNPARTQRQLIGVFSKQLLQPLAEVLKNLGSNHVLVVHAEDGLDEISLFGKTHFAELKGGEIRLGSLSIEDFGLSKGNLKHNVSDITAHGLEQSKLKVLESLTETNKATAKIAMLNASAALYIGGKVNDFKEGFDLARLVVESGEAVAKLEAFVALTNDLEG